MIREEIKGLVRLKKVNTVLTSMSEERNEGEQKCGGSG